MRFYIWVLVGVLVLIWTPHIAAQSVSQEAPVLEIRVDLSALGTNLSEEKPVVTLNGVELDALGTQAGIRYRATLEPGERYVAKALVSGYGADRLSISADEGAVGTFSMTLVPHLTGLDQYIDDYRLEWLDDAQRRIVPTIVPAQLRFVDASGATIPVTALSDARLSMQHFRAVSLPMSDMLTVDEAGIITLTDIAALHQMMVDYKADHSIPQRASLVLAFRARDDETGLVYDAETKPFRVGTVSVAGRIARGESVPDHISLSGIRVSVGRARVETDETGNFEIPRVPAGEVSVSATVYDRRTTETGRRYTVTYRAKETLDLSGPAEVLITLGLRHRDSDGGTVDLVAHDPMPQPAPQDIRLSSRPDLSIPVAARYRMINLTTYEDLTGYGSTGRDPARDETTQTCRKFYEQGWRTFPNCPTAMLGSYISKRPVWSGPEPDAYQIGELHVDGKVWYIEQASNHAALIPAEYYLGDWGYQAFGHAVTVRDLTASRVAIALPQSDAIGWLDLAGLAGGSFRPDTDWGRRNRFLGFYPLESCGERLGREDVVVEALDEDSITYRLPTPHDLWSVYTDTEQPPLEAHESFTINWREAYSADHRLLLVPYPGKEC